VDMNVAEEGVQWLSSRASALPPAIAFPLAQGRRGLRVSLVDLGEQLTGDAARAEIAFALA
jgi:hypothetical protein